MKLFLTTFVLAFRNLLRNRGRTFSTLIAIVVGLLGLTLLDGFINYSVDNFRDSIIRGGTGHAEIFRSPQARDQGDSNPIPYLFENTSALEEELRGMPEVDDVLPVLSFAAVVSGGDKNHSVQVTASPVDQALRDLTKRKVVSGKDLTSARTGFVLLGTGLAKVLKVQPGSTIQLFALSRGGGVNTNSFTVAGIISSELKDVDDRSVAMSLDDAQSLLQVQNVAKLVVFMKNTDDTSVFMHRVAEAPTGSPLSGLTVVGWDKLFTPFEYANSMFQLILAVARLVVLLVALFSISGTLTLSVIERYREIGTLRAFGTRRPHLILLLTLEGLFLGVAGTILGSVCGALASGAINALGGVTMPAQPQMSVSTVDILFIPQADVLWQNGVALLIASIFAALLPGTMSFRRTVAELLRSH
jgi:putative ABC transport system permease protein